MKIMRAWDAALAKRNEDRDSAKLKFNVYRRFLGHFSKEAVDYLATKVIETCQWFPTVSECLKILDGYVRKDQAVIDRENAKLAMHNELQARLDREMALLETGQMDLERFETLPDRWKLIAETRGYVRKVDDGYIIRKAPCLS